MKPFVLLVCALIAFAVIQGCKKDSSKNANAIIGTWENRQIYPTATGRSEVYTFRGDGTFETHITVFNPVGNQTLGYFSKSVGKYVLNGDQLSLNNVSYYGIKGYDINTPAVPENQLVLIGENNTSAYSVTFNTKKDSLSMVSHCPPNADCIGLISLKFKKQ